MMAVLININPIFLFSPIASTLMAMITFQHGLNRKKYSAYCRRKWCMLLFPHPNIAIAGYCLLEETRVCVRMLDQWGSTKWWIGDRHESWWTEGWLQVSQWKIMVSRWVFGGKPVLIDWKEGCAPFRKDFAMALLIHMVYIIVHSFPIEETVL